MYTQKTLVYFLTEGVSRLELETQTIVQEQGHMGEA